MRLDENIKEILIEDMKNRGLIVTSPIRINVEYDEYAGAYILTIPELNIWLHTEDIDSAVLEIKNSIVQDFNRFENLNEDEIGINLVAKGYLATHLERIRTQKKKVEPWGGGVSLWANEK